MYGPLCKTIFSKYLCKKLTFCPYYFVKVKLRYFLNQSIFALNNIYWSQGQSKVILITLDCPWLKLIKELFCLGG